MSSFCTLRSHAHCCVAIPHLAVALLIRMRVQFHDRFNMFVGVLVWAMYITGLVYSIAHVSQD